MRLGQPPPPLINVSSTGRARYPQVSEALCGGDLTGRAERPNFNALLTTRAVKDNRPYLAEHHQHPILYILYPISHILYPTKANRPCPTGGLFLQVCRARYPQVSEALCGGDLTGRAERPNFNALLTTRAVRDNRPYQAKRHQPPPPPISDIRYPRS